MPFVGPEKGAIIQQLVRELQPNLVVEVGSLCGYSAITLAQALPPSARLITIEKDFLWTLAARRFIYQAGVDAACVLHCNSGNIDCFMASRQELVLLMPFVAPLAIWIYVSPCLETSA